MSTWARLRERKVGQVGLAYLAGAWLVLQVVSTLGELYDWPVLFLRLVPIILAFGFPVALVLAWYHGERGRQRVTSVELGILAALLIVAGAGITLAWRQSAGRPIAAAPQRVTEDDVVQTSVAVLPFQNISGDPGQEYFADGLTEELLNALAQIPGLRVPARTSTFAFKGGDVPVDSIARVLRVAHVLEGSVRRDGSRVRIQATLVDAVTGYRRWTRTYNRDLTDIFAVQDEISRAIAAELRIDLGAQPVVRQETADPAAHALVLRGMTMWRQFSLHGGHEATRLFREAIARDSSYARAHALLAGRLAWHAYFRELPRSSYAEARQLAERALALDPQLADAHEVLGRVANMHDWDIVRAGEHLGRAVELNPWDGVARSSRAWLLMRQGRHDDAIAEALRAVDIDPLAAASHNHLGLMYFYAGQLDRAERTFNAALAIAPDYAASAGNLALVYSVTGRHHDAVRMAERTDQLSPGIPFTLGRLVWTYARAGRPADAERHFATLRRLPDPSPYRLAVAYLATGDRPRALEMLERAVAERDDSATFLAVSPELAELRGDPRFEALARAVAGREVR
jgi:adenylate cyclase